MSMQTFTSRFPVVFNPRPQVRATQSSVLIPPHQGHLETMFTEAWERAWVPVRAHLRSQAFIDQLGARPTAEMMEAVIEGYSRHAYAVMENVETILHTVIVNAVADAENNYPISQGRNDPEPVEKGNPFTMGTGPWQRWRERNGLGASATPVTAPSTLDPEIRYRNLARKLRVDMIEMITKKQQQAIHSILTREMTTRRGKTRSVTDNKFWERKARLAATHIADVIGLNARWCKAVENMRGSMEGAEHPARADVIERRVRRYADGLLIKRGVMIARTEMFRAMNAGRQEYWELKVAKGETRGFRVEKWLETMPGACIECVAASDPDASGTPKRYALDGKFDYRDGEMVPYPPIHVHCRCVVNYEMVPTKG